MSRVRSRSPIPGRQNLPDVDGRGWLSKNCCSTNSYSKLIRDHELERVILVGQPQIQQRTDCDVISLIDTSVAARE